MYLIQHHSYKQNSCSNFDIVNTASLSNTTVKSPCDSCNFSDTGEQRANIARTGTHTKALRTSAEEFQQIAVDTPIDALPLLHHVR